MDPEEGRMSLRHKNEQLRHENETLKLTLSLLRENQNLRSKVYGMDESADYGSYEKVSAVTWDDTVDEGQFSRDLLKAPLGTSSPMEISTSRKSTLKSQQVEQGQSDMQETYQPQVKDPERLIGEIGFQLDRRILAHVFQEQHRLYGFTVGNIPEKITQVCTHPLSNKVDESLRSRLTERHLEVLERLGRFGYSATHHPALTELIVNTYGILRQRPDPHSACNYGYGTPEALRRLVVNIVPSTLLKDTLVLHTCLCYLATQDRKPLFVW